MFKNKKKNIEKITEVLKKGTISSENYRSTSMPFFCSNYNQDFKLESISNKYIDKLPKSLNRNIYLIYEIFGNPNKEIYLGEWTILSLKQAIKHYENYCNNNRKNIFDIGYRYIGLGHIESISCDLDSHLLFFRPDGGSNGYDRVFNYNQLIKYGSTSYTKFFFSDWFYNIEFKNDSNNN